MSEAPGGKSMNVSMDAANVYREDVYTDRKVGTIRCMTPVNADGSTDGTRGILFLGETQIMTPMGALPVSFEVPATTLAEAIEKYGESAKEGIERTVKEIQEMRRQAASSIVLPGAGGGLPPGGLGGGGKIQLS
jgi:hypothetical protein